MSDILNYTDPLRSLIYQPYEKEPQRFRNHLGASEIGDDCERKLWYKFRHVKLEVFSGRILMLFETGNMEENRLIDLLKKSGITFESTQERFEDLGGHFAGSCDGIISNVPGYGNKKHILEIKTHNQKSFSALEKHGVEKSKPQHYIQMMIYMHYFKIDRAFYLAKNKNDEEIYSERIKYIPSVAMAAIAKAKRIIFSDRAPFRVSTKKDFYLCKMCGFSGICHGTEKSLVNCRTCVFSTPVEGGLWECSNKNRNNPDTKIGECDHHVYHPDCFPGDVVDAGEDYIVYKVIKNNNEIDIINGFNFTKSKDINIL